MANSVDQGPKLRVFKTAKQRRIAVILRGINHNTAEISQSFLPLLLIMWVFHQIFRISKGFQLYYLLLEKFDSVCTVNSGAHPQWFSEAVPLSGEVTGSADFLPLPAILLLKNCISSFPLSKV